MDCKSIKNAGHAERYLHNRLNEAELEAFETHLLECNRCTHDLELLQATQADLVERAHEIRTWTPAKPFFLRWQTMGVAALVVVVVASAIFFRAKKAEQVLTAQHVPPSTGPKDSQTPEKPKQATIEGADAVDNSVNGARDGRIERLPVNGRNYTTFSPKNKTKDTAPKIGPAPSSGINLDKAHGKNKEGDAAESVHGTAGGQETTQVAKTDPRTSQPIPKQRDEAPALTQEQGMELYYLGSTTAPSFTFSGFSSKRLTVEGGGVSSNSHPARSIDSSRAAFRDAMNAYIEGNYSEAAERLEQAAVKEPGALDVQFYLGVCRLLIGQPQRAIEPLTNGAKAPSPVVQQQVHYYLAKAYVQSLRLQEAENEFRIASQLTGPLKNDAGNLLNRLQALRAQLGQN